jgi:competence protein ComEC
MTKSEKTMLGFIFVFLSSALWPSLPQISLIAFVSIVLIFGLIYRVSAVLCGMLMGFIWASICGHYYLDWQIDSSLFHQNILVEGEVLSLQPPITEVGQTLPNYVSKDKQNKQELPVKNHIDFTPDTARRFNFLIHKIGPREQWLKAKVRLTWYGESLAFQQGDKLKLFIRLKPPVGLGNPDGFNYQTWLTSKNITALGHVKVSPSNQILERNQSIRQKWVNSLLEHELSNIRWIVALSYGDRRLLTQSDWELMQRTGTAHLFAISGMHLGIVFGFTLILTKGCVVLLSLCANAFTFVRGKHNLVFKSSSTETKQQSTYLVKINLKPWLIVLPCMICVFYALIAGFQIPVLRALLTLIIWTLLLILSIHWRASSVLLLLLSSFFILFPFSILGISFWFSFIAVLVILLFVWRITFKTHSSILSKMSYAIRLQLFISIITMPMIAMTFSSIPINAFFANLFMIPLITFVLVPLCLLAAVGSSVSLNPYYIYKVINLCFDWAFKLLNWLDQFSVFLLGNNWESSTAAQTSLFLLTQPIIVLVTLLWVFPSWHHKRRLLFSILSVSLLYYYYESQQLKNTNPSSLYFMDVGQGSAVVIKDSAGTMLYDTGGAFAGFSMANSVLLPFFKTHRIKHLDYFVLSHLDNDHAGGANVIKQNVSIQRTLSPYEGCNVDAFLTDFSMDKRKFLSYDVQILWPLKSMSGDNNDHSCVMKLQRGKHSILLTGDIEKKSEAQILALYKTTNKLKSTILAAPHHGSQTSSTSAFIEAVSPEYVVFSSGAYNRWGFPAQSVVNRYQHINAQVFITGQQGRIKFVLSDEHISVSAYREDEYNRWYFKVRL